ncbi:MAG TPA: hypothetical protein VN372_07330 [Methanospirillum sp.]|nr:hypothetical protein [Methanospirillum sp.]
MVPPPTHQRTIRLPPNVYDRMFDIAQQRFRPVIDIVIEACEQYVNANIPIICQSCTKSNPNGSKFCNFCGNQMSGDTPDDPIADLQNQINEMKTRMTDLLTAVKLAQEDPEAFKQYTFHQ